MFSSFGARMNDVRREKWVFRYKYINAFPLFSFNPVETGEEEVGVSYSKIFFLQSLCSLLIPLKLEINGFQLRVAHLCHLEKHLRLGSLGEGWFLGIWYKNVPERTYVWVGNRQYPLHSSNGNLEIYDGKLVIGTKFIGAPPLLFRLTWNDQQIFYLSITTTDNRSYTRGSRPLWKKKSKTELIVDTCVCISVLALFLALLCYCKRKKKRERATTAATIEIMMPRERENAIEDQPSAPMDFAMILNATDNFSQEIGHGGFGYVYKGMLANEEEIAVKKLSEISKQGSEISKQIILLFHWLSSRLRKLF
ncbi:hypothetical protein DY000_02032539 [Brassica cretica]|uniref:Protein kinase domain-containing protein n=1 Tax=Brassica cretica TaxID=69181 RepID=A0ABQ7DH04_BRACR|nr:hypothetical protein DY000_02032539 [Brassica cretica]